MTDENVPTARETKILNSCLYLSGDLFTAAEMATQIRATPREVGLAIKALMKREKLICDSRGKYMRPIRHDIHKMKLADTSFLKEMVEDE